MSVLTPVVDSWDGANRRIYLKPDVSDYYPIDDIYAEYRHERRVNENFRIWDALLRAEGNVPKGAGAFTPRYVVLLDGTKIVPYDNTTQVNQLGDMITDNPDVDPTLYDTSTLTVPKVIYIKPSEAETIQLNSEAIVYSSFQGAAWYNVNSIYSDRGSATEPNGNTERPVNSIPLCASIAFDRGFKDIQLRSNTDLVSGDNVEGLALRGINPTQTYLNIADPALTINCQVFNCTINGILDGNSHIIDSVIETLEYVNGEMHHCMFNNKITLGGSKVAHMHSCYSGIPGIGTPEIDCGGAGQSFALRAYDGGIKITNKTGVESCSIDLNSGQVRLTDTITNGLIVCRGTGKVVNDATDEMIPPGVSDWNGCTILNETSLAYLNTDNKMVYNKAVRNGDIVTIYESDGLTIWKQFDLSNGGRVEL